ncbi:MAG: zinc-binding alcohol dehydrogenase [Bacteroidales bacterium]|nr:zinc-binding alcohol dehydrogenase [Bacteroidales bacterium]
MKIESRKIVFTKNHDITLEKEVKELTIQNGNEVIIKNHCTHISLGTEMACLAGLESWFPLPGTPGYTSIGEVIEIGSDVSGIKAGDLVYTMGPHSGYFKIHSGDRWSGLCVKVPEKLSPELASFTHMAGIAMTSIRKSQIEIGDYVLVAGLGAIGNLAAQLAVLQGAKVIAVDLEEKRLDIARKCNIPLCINSSEENIIGKIKELTGGKGINTFIDATGMSSVINRYGETLATNGEIILLGSPRSPFETNLTAFLKYFHYLPYLASLKGALEFAYPTYENDFVKHSIERNSKIIMDLFLNKKLILNGIYSHKITPEEAPDVYRKLNSNKMSILE